MRAVHPPDWLDQILEWYCSEYYLEEVQGDLHEWYEKMARSQGVRAANVKYAWMILRYFKFFRLKPVEKLVKNPKYISMKSIVKITLRNIRRDKLSGTIRIGNLALGMLVFLLTMSYARYELNYDQFHDKKDVIYRVGPSYEGSPWAATPLGMGQTIREKVADVTNVVRFMPIRDTFIRLGDKQFFEKGGFWVDPEVFELFGYDFIQGDPITALKDPKSIVLTESIARKYYGDTNPVGQRLTLSAFKNDEGEYDDRMVTGVIKDVPEQAHLQFDFLCSAKHFDPEFLAKWQNFWVYTYVEIPNRDQLATVQDLVKQEFMEKRNMNADEAEFLKIELTPLTKIHLYANHEKEHADNGDIANVYVLFAIGIFVLIITSINFINLSVIKGLDRAKEVGIRKTVGASRHQVIIQFLGENLVLLLVAGCLSLLGLLLLTPVVRDFSGVQLPINFFENPGILIPVLIILGVLELVCGLYPALVLSEFRSIDIISSRRSAASASVSLTRHILMVAQFSLSIILVIGSLVVYKQLKFVQEQDLGFEKDQIATVQIKRTIRNDFETFEKELLQVAGIKSISTSSSVPGYRVMMSGGRDLSSNEDFDLRVLYSDETFLETFDIELLDGKNFDRHIKRGDNEFMLNEKAVAMMYPEIDPLGQKIAVSGDTGLIIGVVKDFNFQTLHSDIEPLVIRNLPVAWFGLAAIKFEAAATGQVLEAIERISAQVYPHLPPMEVTFLDHRFAQLYEAESKLQAIVWLFCVITILLTISGIFGVATYNAHRRAKEIAIRKVLGGSLLGLLGHLSRGFIILLVVSLVIGVPGAYFLSDWWLQDYAYRVMVDPGIFILSALVMLVIVAASAGFVTFKAASLNPTLALKSE